MKTSQLSRSRSTYGRLEPRQLLASISFESGEILVRGNATADVIELVGGADFQSFTVRINDAANLTETFQYSDVSKLTVFAGGGNDRVTNTLRRDSIVYGGDGNDFIEGGYKNDLLYGGNGIDTLVGRNGNDTLRGQSGTDWMYGGPGVDRLFGFDGNDRLFGGTGNDVLRGEAGNDELRGQDGADRLFGGNDNDRIFGEGGNDQMLGENGDDLLIGGLGNDRMEGGAGDDLLNGNEGNDTIYAGLGDDTVNGGLGDDAIFGVDGTNKLRGNGGKDQINGGDGADEIDGGSGDDHLAGGDGDDRLEGLQGADTLLGGDDNDVLLGGDGNDSLSGQRGNDRLEGGSGADNLSGGNDNDRLLGGPGNDLLHGGDDDDTMFGEEGDDRLNGGEGENTMFGNAGNDEFFKSYSRAYTNDRINGGPGIDQVSNLLAQEYDLQLKRVGSEIRLSDVRSPAFGSTIGRATLTGIENLEGRGERNRKTLFPIGSLLGKPIVERVTVQPVVVSNNNGSDTSPAFGNAQQEAEIKRRVNRIYAQAGIEIKWLPTKQWNSTFANGPGQGTRAISEFSEIISRGDEAGIGSQNPRIVDYYFINRVPGQVRPETSGGRAFIGQSGGVQSVGDSILDSEDGRDAVAYVFAHELAHNLGLQHTDENTSLLSSRYRVGSTNKFISQEQIQQMLASDITRPI